MNRSPSTRARYADRSRGVSLSLLERFPRRRTQGVFFFFFFFISSLPRMRVFAKSLLKSVIHKYSLISRGFFVLLDLLLGSKCSQTTYAYVSLFALCLFLFFFIFFSSRRGTHVRGFDNEANWVTPRGEFSADLPAFYSGAPLENKKNDSRRSAVFESTAIVFFSSPGYLSFMLEGIT